MNNKLSFLLIAISVLLLFGCKKENQNSDPINNSSAIIGLWEVKLLTITRYDNANNIIKIDTAIYTNELGQPVTLLEKYTSDHKFIQFANTINDTSLVSTFTLTGNTIKINLSDNVFPFNNRTITKIDDFSLEVYQVNPGSYSLEKWTQKYVRR